MPASFESRLLWFYGLYAIVSGLYFFAQGGWMVLAPTASGAPAESNFIGHLTQAHAGSIVGLGCIALGMSVTRRHVRTLLVAFAMANVLLAMVTLLSAPALTPWLLAEMAIHTLWAILFAVVATRSGPDEVIAGTRGGLRTGLYVSFAFLVALSGLVWLLAPLKFAAAAAGELAGVAAVYTGQARGAADLTIAVIAWLARGWGGTQSGRAITRSLCISNVLLATAGLIAQLSVLATPARWAVEALHVIWAIGFAMLWCFERRSHRATAAAAA
jgi:hypothetical protein